ncbi:MAG: homoserine kinase [Gammaproteobacteria bacterium]|nr:homoserine kinase [Gammaproteobacteria bacterium]
MAVYTPVETQALADFLRGYDVGALVCQEGIDEGVSNTSYFVTTTAGEYVLTLLESPGEEDAAYFLELAGFLAARGVPCPRPVPDRDGSPLGRLTGKPAALAERLHGQPVVAPAPAHCGAIGRALGRLHVAARDFPRRRANNRGPRWWRETIDALRPHLGHGEAALLEEELRFQALFRFTDLPRGVIHGDLFRDNVLFEGSTPSGMLDLYDACDDVLLYDLAVAANDWCSEHDGGLAVDRLRALLSGYHAVRGLEPVERGAWPVMLRAAALRFWVSRLRAAHFPRAGSVTPAKDPERFRRVLEARITRQSELQAVWV